MEQCADDDDAFFWPSIDRTTVDDGDDFIQDYYQSHCLKTFLLSDRLIPALAKGRMDVIDILKQNVIKLAELMICEDNDGDNDDDDNYDNNNEDDDNNLNDRENAFRDTNARISMIAHECFCVDYAALIRHGVEDPFFWDTILKPIYCLPPTNTASAHRALSLLLNAIELEIPTVHASVRDALLKHSDIESYGLLSSLAFDDNPLLYCLLVHLHEEVVVDFLRCLLTRYNSNCETAALFANISSLPFYLIEQLTASHHIRSYSPCGAIERIENVSMIINHILLLPSTASRFEDLFKNAISPETVSALLLALQDKAQVVVGIASSICSSLLDKCYDILAERERRDHKDSTRPSVHADSMTCSSEVLGESQGTFPLLEICQEETNLIGMSSSHTLWDKLVCTDDGVLDAHTISESTIDSIHTMLLSIADGPLRGLIWNYLKLQCSRAIEHKQHRDSKRGRIISDNRSSSTTEEQKAPRARIDLLTLGFFQVLQSFSRLLISQSSLDLMKDCLPLTIEIFLTFKWCTLLHNIVESILSNLLHLGSNSDDVVQSVLRSIIDHDVLIPKIVKIIKTRHKIRQHNSIATRRQKQLRHKTGYMPHLLRLAESLDQCARHFPWFADYLSSEVCAWDAVVREEIRYFAAIRKELLGGPLPETDSRHDSKITGFAYDDTSSSSSSHFSSGERHDRDRQRSERTISADLADWGD